MIRTIRGTVYLTAEAFCDRLNFAQRGQRFTYATGNLVQACAMDRDARELRQLVERLAEAKRIMLAQHARLDPVWLGRGSYFEYLATKCSTTPAHYQRTDTSRRSHPAKADERTTAAPARNPQKLLT